jgi:hypothetical protein
MEAFYEFAGEHPFLTFCLAWGIWPVCWTIRVVLTMPFSLAFKAYNRRLRAKNIQLHGWPTAQFLDADGDIIYPPVEAQKNNG